MDFLKHNIWAVILIGIVFSFLFPAVGILVSPLLNPLFMLLMFLSTLDIKIREVVKDIKRPGKTIIVLLIIHLLSPMIVLAFKPLFSPEIFLGLILATTTSSGISVVFLSKLFGGEPSRSLVITTISNILAPITIPLLVLLFAHQSIDVDPFAMGLTILKLVILPLLVAQFVAHTSWKKRIEKYSTEVLIGTLLLIIIGIVSPARNYIFGHLLLSLGLAGFVALLNIIDFTLGFSVGKKLSSKISFGISASFKNFTLSTVLAISLFGTVVALPSIIYAVVNSFLLIPMQWYVEGLQEKKK